MGEARSRRSELSERNAFVALQILAENGGKMPFGEIVEEVFAREGDKFLPEDVEKNSQGINNWVNRLRFAALQLKDAGFLRKEKLDTKRFWVLTELGRQSLKTMSEEQITEAGLEAKRKMRGANRGNR